MRIYEWTWYNRSADTRMGIANHVWLLRLLAGTESGGRYVARSATAAKSGSLEPRTYAAHVSILTFESDVSVLGSDRYAVDVNGP